MEPKSVATVLPVPDLEQGVAFWRAALGVEPTFVDGDRWAQFDLDGRRIALAGSDRSSDQAGVMLKVDDLEAAAAELAEHGVELGPAEEGPHELRRSGKSPGGWSIVVYSPK
jgi:hypothetical protein